MARPLFAASKKGLFYVAIAAFYFICFSAFASSSATSFQNLLNDYTQSGRLPGVVLGVFIDDSAPFYLVSGMGNIQSNEAIHADSLFKFGSSLKTITAMLLLDKLKSENISVHVTLGEILKTHPNLFSGELRKLEEEFPFLSKITLLQLLNHTSHLVDEQSTAEYFLKFSQEKDVFIELQNHLRYSLSRGLTNNYFTYANVNYILLGSVIEILYNKSFNDIISQEIFSKLNLKNSFYYSSQQDIKKLCTQQAHAYEPTNLGSVSVFKDRFIIQNYQNSQRDYIDLTCAYDPSWDAGPAGALLSTPIDFGTIANSFFYKKSSFAKTYWDFIKSLPDDQNAKTWWGPIEMNYKLGIWRGTLSNGLEFWRLIGEQWGFSGGAIFVPKQNKMHHSILLIYAINTDQPSFLEGSRLDDGLISNLLQLIEKM